MKNLFSVEGKVVVMTGACGILGATIVKHFAEQGAKVVLLDLERTTEIAHGLIAEIEAAGGEACFFATNVLDKAALEENYRQIMARYGTIDILLNAAGGNMGLRFRIGAASADTRGRLRRGEGRRSKLDEVPLRRAGHEVRRRAACQRYRPGLPADEPEPHAPDEPRRLADAPFAHHPGPHALRPLPRTRRAGRHAAIPRLGRLEGRERHGDRRRRRLRRLLDLKPAAAFFGPGGPAAEQTGLLSSCARLPPSAGGAGCGSLRKTAIQNEKLKVKHDLLGLQLAMGRTSGKRVAGLRRAKLRPAAAPAGAANSCFKIRCGVDACGIDFHSGRGPQPSGRACF